MAKENPNNAPLQFAYYMMSNTSKSNGRDYDILPDDYADARLRFVDASKYMHKNNPNYAMHGKITSDETKQVLSEKAIERWSDVEFRDQMSSIIKSKWEDDDYRQTHCDAMRGKKHKVSKKKCPNCGREIATFNFDRHYYACIGESIITDDIKKNISKGVNKYYEDENSHKLASERIKKQWENPEFREKVLSGRGLI